MSDVTSIETGVLFVKYVSQLLKTIVFLTAATFYIGSATAAPLPDIAAPPAALADQSTSDEVALTEVAPNLRRQSVVYSANVTPGTVIIDTADTYLYYVNGDGTAIRYGIGVGRQGFAWAGVEHVTRKAEWPDWYPPAEMIARQPYLARFTAGGEGNPLGARAIYLGTTLYRIHGTNAPETIGTDVSSGCIRMLNADVIDLYSRVKVGTKIIVLPNRMAVVASIPAQAVPSNFRSNIY
jgi:lipoprotein-anchoring transpeptidase ErfK/SrfK